MQRRSSSWGARTPRSAPRRLLQRRELTALERQRVAELEGEATRTDLTPAQVQALNDERNAIVEGRGMNPRSTAEQATQVAQLDAAAGRSDLTPQQLLDLNQARNPAAVPRR